MDRFLLPGQGDDNATEFPGGEAFNTATALAGWGVNVTLTGTAVGDDAEGLRLRELLQSHPLAQGLDLSLLPHVSGAVTPVCTVRVDANGERFMSGRGFAEATPPNLETILPTLVDRPLFTVDPNLGKAAIEATLAAATAGCPIVSMDCAAIPEILAASQVAVTSHEWISRSACGTSAEDGARRIARSGAGLSIVTEGIAGGICFRSDEMFRYGALPVSAFPEPKIVDTTGAGDIFRAGLCYMLARPLPQLARVLRFASTAAALHCTVFGGGSRIPLGVVKKLAPEVRVTRL
ncbi:MAG: carbohydrate kinase family protein [Akkermansiaceae bacterium]|nr:carbohydrate kinase family protein [Armatimonadota bacterium]